MCRLLVGLHINKYIIRMLHFYTIIQLVYVYYYTEKTLFIYKKKLLNVPPTTFITTFNDAGYNV